MLVACGLTWKDLWEFQPQTRPLMLNPWDFTHDLFFTQQFHGICWDTNEITICNIIKTRFFPSKFPEVKVQNIHTFSPTKQLLPRHQVLLKALKGVCCPRPQASAGSQSLQGLWVKTHAIGAGGIKLSTASITRLKCKTLEFPMEKTDENLSPTWTVFRHICGWLPWEWS